MLRRLDWLQTLLVAALLLSLWPAWRFVSFEVRAAPRRLEHVRGTTPEARERARLDWQGRVRGLWTVERSVRPLLDPARLLGTRFTYVAAGSRALRGATVLSERLAPGALVTGATPELLAQWLADPAGSTGLAHLEQSAFIVWAGVTPADIARLQALAERRYGRPVLVPGRALAPDLAVSLRFDVHAGCLAGDPRWRRLRPLLRP